MWILPFCLRGKVFDLWLKDVEKIVSSGEKMHMNCPRKTLWWEKLKNLTNRSHSMGSRQWGRKEQSNG